MASAYTHRAPRAPGLLIRAMVLVLALYAVGVLLHPFPVGISDLLQAIVFPVVFVSSAALCFIKARVARRERTEWWLLALAMALWGAGSAFYAILYSNHEEVPVPSIADALWIAFYAPAYLAILGLLRKRAGSFGRAVWLDALIGALGVGGAAVLVVFDNVQASASGTPAAVLTTLAYPVGDIGLVALLAAAMTVVGWRNSGVLRWIAPAFTVFAVTDSLYFLGVANGSYVPGGIIDLGWPIAALLVGLAACRPDTVPPAEERNKLMIGVPGAVGVAAVGLLVSDHFERTSTIVVALATGSLIAILLRLYLTVRENTGLLECSQREAMTDSLTGLGNRRQLTADLAAHAGLLQDSSSLEMALFDLDGFKQYNDTLGHQAGDLLLARLGGNLSELVEGFGTAYRVGGDEFCTLWNTWDAHSAGVTIDDAAAALSERGDVCPIECSFGTVTLPAETADTGEALRLADRRMYAKKGRGRQGRRINDALQDAPVQCDCAQAVNPALDRSREGW